MATTSMSASGRPAMIRKTARPIRPNPLIATFTPISRLLDEIGGEAFDDFNHPRGIAPTVVEPGDGLDYGAVDHHRSQRIEDPRVGGDPHVRRHDGDADALKEVAAAGRGGFLDGLVD